MKKAFLINLLLLHLFSHAQKSKVEIGFQGGINLNSAYKSPIPKDVMGSITGISLGASIKYHFTNRFGLKAQPAYDQFGWAYRSLVYESNLFNNTRTDILYKVNYLNLPVLAEYSVGKKVKWNMNAGVFAGILLQGKWVEKTIPSNTIGQPTSSTTTIQNLNKLNFGLAIGTGIQIPLTNKIALNIEVRNVVGLTKVITYNSSRTLTYSFLSGLSFHL